MQWMLEFLTRCWIHQDLCLVIRTNEACWRRLDGFVRQLHWTEDFWQLLAYFCYRAQNFWVLFGIPVLQSVPANKHIEVNAKPSICLFLLKSEPWDKHIYAYFSLASGSRDPSLEARRQQVTGGGSTGSFATQSVCTALSQAPCIMHGLRPLILLPAVPALAMGVGARRGGKVISCRCLGENMDANKSKFDGRAARIFRARCCGFLSLFHHKDTCNDNRFLNLHS